MWQLYLIYKIPTKDGVRDIYLMYIIEIISLTVSCRIIFPIRKKYTNHVKMLEIQFILFKMKYILHSTLREKCFQLQKGTTFKTSNKRNYKFLSGI